MLVELWFYNKNKTLIYILCSVDRASQYIYILCSVDRAAQYIRVKKSQLDAQFSVYFVKPVRVSGITKAHHQEAYCKPRTVDTYCSFEMTVCYLVWVPTNQDSRQAYGMPPDDGLWLHPKHVEV